MAAGGEPVRVALVGAGDIARVGHLPAWQSNARARVEFVVDSDLQRAKEVAAAFGVAHASSDFQAVIGSGEVDAVDICTPPHLHAPMTLAALAAGLHVLVEKPVAPTLEAVRQMVDAANDAGRTLMVAENWLFSTARRRAEDLIREHALGDPFLVRARHQSNLYADGTAGTPEWSFSPESAGGGYMMQAGVHTMALLEALVGPVEYIAAFSDVASSGQAAGSDDALPVDRSAVAIAQFECGALGSLTFTARSRHFGPRRLGVELFYERGHVEFDVWTGEVILTADGVSTTVRSQETSMGFAEEIAHFVECIETGHEPLSSPQRLCSSLGALLASYRSAEEGRAVPVREVMAL